MCLCLHLVLWFPLICILGPCIGTRPSRLHLPRCWILHMHVNISYSDKNSVVSVT